MRGHLDGFALEVRGVLLLPEPPVMQHIKHGARAAQAALIQKQRALMLLLLTDTDTPTAVQTALVDQY